MARSLAIVLLLFVLAATRNVNAQGVFVENGGSVVGEAEHFSLRADGPEKSWRIVPGEASGVPATFANYRGTGYVQALPDNNGGGGGVNVPPYIDFKLCIETPGTYRLYVRWDGHNDNSDTFFASILELHDGAGGSIADWYRYIRITDDSNFATGPWFGSGGFERTDSPFSDGEVPVVWSIGAAGLYTLRLSMREDGAAIDSFVFQLSNLPAPTGSGPAESEIAEACGVVGVEAHSWSLVKMRYR